jgi:hypothetical protein
MTASAARVTGASEKTDFTVQPGRLGRLKIVIRLLYKIISFYGTAVKIVTALILLRETSLASKSFVRVLGLH